MPQTKPLTFSLRLPPSLYEALKKKATENDRSVNAEIVNILKASAKC